MDNPLIAKKFEMDNPLVEIFFKKAQHAIKKFFQSPRFHQKVCIPSFPIKMFRSPPPGGFFVLFSLKSACFSFMYWVKYFMYCSIYFMYLIKGGCAVIRITLDVEMAKKRMSLTRLSEEVGISMTNLSLLKNNKVKALKLSTLEALCKALDCDVADLVRMEETDA